MRCQLLVYIVSTKSISGRYIATSMNAMNAPSTMIATGSIKVAEVTIPTVENNSQKFFKCMGIMLGTLPPIDIVQRSIA